MDSESLSNLCILYHNLSSKYRARAQVPQAVESPPHIHQHAKFTFMHQLYSANQRVLEYHNIEPSYIFRSTTVTSCEKNALDLSSHTVQSPPVFWTFIEPHYSTLE